MVILDDGVKLDAKLDMPTPAEGKHPLVLIIHGFTGHKEERHLVAVSQMLNEIGCATLRVDMYGHGASEGKFRDHTLYKWLTNAMTAVDYARKLDFVTDIYLLGHSQGGLTVILTGGLEHDRIKGIIPLSPACMIPDLARNGTLLGTNFDPDHLPEELTVWNDWQLGNNYIRVAQTIHVEEAVDRYAGPVLIVQGSQDDPSLIQSAKDAAARYKNCQFALIEGDTHCYDLHLDRMVDTVKAWMLRQLSA